MCELEVPVLCAHYRICWIVADICLMNTVLFRGKDVWELSVKLSPTTQQDRHRPLYMWESLSLCNYVNMCLRGEINRRRRTHTNLHSSGDFVILGSSR